MISDRFPMPDVSEEDTQPLVYEPPVDTLALLTVGVPRSYGRIAEQLAADADANFWLNDPPLPFPEITMRHKVARGLRQIANYLERGVK